MPADRAENRKNPLRRRGTICGRNATRAIRAKRIPKHNQLEGVLFKLPKTSRIEIHERKIFCPIVHQEIGDLNCDDVSNVVDGGHPERFAPEEIRSVKNWKEICQNCPNNGYNEV